MVTVSPPGHVPKAYNECLRLQIALNPTGAVPFSYAHTWEKLSFRSGAQ